MQVLPSCYRSVKYGASSLTAAAQQADFVVETFAVALVPMVAGQPSRQAARHVLSGVHEIFSGLGDAALDVRDVQRSTVAAVQRRELGVSQECEVAGRPHGEIEPGRPSVQRALHRGWRFGVWTWVARADDLTSLTEALCFFVCAKERKA